MKKNIKSVTTVSILKDRIDLYRDFTYNLLYYIVNYYIDYDSMSTDEIINNHYTWCFNKVCEDFLLEGIDFRKNKNLRSYFFGFYYNKFYRAQDTDADISLEYFEKFWKSIFNIDKQKTESSLKLLIELYLVFDQTFNKKLENIFEEK